MKGIKILIPIPCYGFEPAEVSIPWKLLTEQGVEVVFTTPDGKKSSPDELMLTGKRLGIYKAVLGTRKDVVAAYLEMEKNTSFCHPLIYADAREEDFDGLLLPGGHDKRIKEYLESALLQNLVVDFFIAQKPVAAICHGVVLAARSIDPATNQSVIHNYKTTSLLKTQELLAYTLTKAWLKDYYLTYPEITVEDEVKSVLSDEKLFFKGSMPLLKDSHKHLKRGFVVKDRNYLSARWPGDVYKFSVEFIQMLQDEKNA